MITSQCVKHIAGTVNPTLEDQERLPKVIVDVETQMTNSSWSAKGTQSLPGGSSACKRPEG